MIRNILLSTVVLAAFAAPTFAATAATDFYVAQDAKTHACMVSDQKPDGKMMMDAGTKVYASKANAEQAMANLKVCAPAAAATTAKPAAPAAAAAVKPAAPAAAATTMAKPAAPAAGTAMKPMAAMAMGKFYVEQDAKTHKCMVDDKKPDGKMMMDVGTKVYKTKGRAEQAMANLKACKS